MSTFKKTKVVMLPTNEKAGKISMGNTSLKLDYHIFPMEKGGIYTNHTYQHLYFLSDEQIKEGEHCYDEVENRLIVNQYKNQVSKKRKKIIATTDKSLRLYESETLASASGFSLKTDDILLPQPSQSFIQKFVEEYNKGNVITEVMVEYYYYTFGSNKEELTNNEKLVPKINPKDNTITIRKIKDSWSREEVKQLFDEWNDIVYKGFYVGKKDLETVLDYSDKWIEENL